MNDSFDAFEYFVYLRTRWRVLSASCLLAAVLAAGFSLLLPKRYTAVATILIDAPAGNDPRAATAVSPVYLESLRTYEHFASSDSLFVRAVERFHLQDEAGGTPIDTLKRRVLKVSKLRDTKLLEIGVTLTNASKAQAVTQFIAEETVNLNKSLSRQSDDEVTAEARRQMEVALLRLSDAEKASNAEQVRTPVDSLQSELAALLGLRSRLHRELVEANIDHADYAAQQKAQTPGDDAEQVKRGVAGIGARMDTIQKELESVNNNIRITEASVAQGRSKLDHLQADHRSARTAYEAALTRWNDAQSAVGIRGERLKIVDPGIVPQLPSSPNIPLNVFLAVAIAFLGASLYVTVHFVSESRSKTHHIRPAYR